MRKNTTMLVCLDVHKDSIAVACALIDPGTDVVFIGQIGTRPGDIDRQVPISS
jgi:hypothetical protein